MQPLILAKRAWLLVFISFAAFYLWGLGSLPFVGPDEPRYAEVAREMLARRDLITPTLGGLPWFEKPPLLYWMMMLGYRLFGVNEYAARLGPALCGLLTAIFVYAIGRTVDDEEFHHGRTGAGQIGRWSALVWLSSLGAIGFSRAASFDIVLTMTVAGAFALLDAARRSEGGGRVPAPALLFGFYFFTGLSILAKGLIGPIVIFGVIALYHAIRRERPWNFARSLVWGIPISMAVAAVWFLPMIMRHGWTFIDQFIVQHHFARFVSNKYHHPAPFYFYLPVVLGLALPWTMILVAAVFSVRHWNARGRAAVDRLRLFALIWLILPIVFFSFSGSKLIAYVMPVLPAAALLAGERIVCVLRAERGVKVLRVTGLMLIAVVAGAYFYIHGRVVLNTYCLVGAAAPSILIGALALIRPQLRKPLFVLVALAFTTSALIAFRCAAPAVASSQSVRDLLAVAAARGYGATPVVQLHTVERTAEFYGAGRLSYGADGEPVKFESVLQVVEVARGNNGLVLCLIPSNLKSQLISYQGAGSEEIGDNGRVALLLVRTR